MNIQLSREERANGQQAARGRTWFAKSAGAHNKAVSVNTSPMSNELVGVMGEIAVAKLFEVELNLHVMGADSGHDLWVHGRSIDVKAKYGDDNKTKLIFENEDSFKADYVVMVTVVNLYGWCRIDGCEDKAGFLAKATKSELCAGRGECLHLETTQLRGISALWHHVNALRLECQ